MKINFGDYTYFDPESKDTQTYLNPNANQQRFAFDEKKFNGLIANRQYNDAADYAAMFHFSDPETQRAHENDIINLRREGRVLGAIYSKIDDVEKLNQIEFYDKLFTDGGLEQLSGNKYAEEFIKYKRFLGSSNTQDGHNNIKEEATSLSVTFYPGTQKGIFGIDWLKRDNENTIDNFYKHSGLSERELKANGIEVIKKDGNTTLKFDKSNALANSIIYNLPQTTEHNLLGIQGYNSKGDMVDYGVYRGTWATSTIRSNGGWAIRAIKNLVDNSKSSKEEYFKKTDLAEKDYSSTIGPAISDDLSILKQALATGQIDETTYNKQFNIYCGHIVDAVKSLGSENYEMYTNAYNKEATDETLISAENTQRSRLVNLISNTSPKDMELLAMCSNGKIGTLISIDAGDMTTEQKKAVSETSLPGNLYSNRRIQIFIPGLMQEQAQAKINKNTSSRSIQEANSILDWDYTYKCADGTEVSPNGNGGFLINNSPVTKDEAVKAINKDMIIQDAIHTLKFNYLNANGDLVSGKDNDMSGAEKYEAMARLIAVRAGNELNSEIPLVKDDGTPYTVEEIFAMKGLSTSFNRYNDEGEIYSSLPYQINKKLESIYNVYEAIMEELRYYNIDPDFKIKK